VQITDGFAGHLACIKHLDGGAHLGEHVEDAGAGGVEAYVFDGEVGAGSDGAGHKPEGGGADVAGHHHPLADQAAGGLDGHRGAAGFAEKDVGAEGAQHAFAVVAGEGRLDHGGGAAGGEAGEQQGALHLGGGHRRVDGGAAQLLPGDRQGREVAALAAGDPRAHLRQGPGHPPHGPAPQRLITVEHEVPPGAPGQQAEHQPHGGAGVAAVQNVVGFLEAIEPHPLHANGLPGLDRRDHHPHGPQAGGGAEGIFGRQQPLDHRLPFGDGAKQQGPMGDRLVAWHPHRAAQAAAAREGEQPVGGAGEGFGWGGHAGSGDLGDPMERGCVRSGSLCPQRRSLQHCWSILCFITTSLIPPICQDFLRLLGVDRITPLSGNRMARLWLSALHMQGSPVESELY